jgi:hypothetical protein
MLAAAGAGDGLYRSRDHLMLATAGAGDLRFGALVKRSVATALVNGRLGALAFA